MKTKLCRPILVPTNEKAHFNDLVINPITKELFQFQHQNCTELKQKLILISLDPEEKIEVGDKVLRPDGVIVNMSHSNMITYLYSQSKAIKKIIATQDQLLQQYIQQFVEQYNSGKVEDVEIEMTKWINFSGDNFNTFVYYSPKLINNQVQIVKKKPILYTEEEVYNYCLKALEMGFDLNNNPFPRLNEKSGKQYFTDWFEQNKKK